MLCAKVMLTAFHITTVAQLGEKRERVKLARNIAFMDLHPCMQSEEGAVAEL